MINSCREPGEICRIIGKKAWELNPQSYVIISLWEPDEDKIIVQGAYGFEDKYQELERILGWDLRKFSIKPDINFGKNTIPEAREKKLILMKNGVYDLLGHTVSETVTRLVQRFLGVETVYHIGFGWKP
jgi:hypothetical protein